MCKYWYQVGYVAQFNTPTGTYTEYGDEKVSANRPIATSRTVDILRTELTKKHRVPVGQGIVTMGSPTIVITGIFYLAEEE